MQRTTQGELCWIDLGAADLDAQTEFYEKLFDWTHADVPTDMGPIYRQFMLDDRVVAGAAQQSPDQQGMPSMWNLYICATDADDVAGRVPAAGGQVFMPVMRVMQEGRMLGIQDPTGGVVMFWEPGNHKGASVFGETGSMGWADLNTRDPERATAFFSDLLGWEFEQLQGGDMPYWQISVNGVPQGGIMPMPPGLPAEVPPHWLVYFMVDDAAAALDRVRAGGGSAEMEPMTQGGVTFAVASDPAGATFAVMEPMRG